MKNFGVMFEYGQHVNKDYERALQWYKLAMDNGDADATACYDSLAKRIKQ